MNLRKIILQFAQRVESCPGGVGGCAPDLTQYIGGFRCTLETAEGRLVGMVNDHPVLAIMIPSPGNAPCPRR